MAGTVIIGLTAPTFVVLIATACCFTGTLANAQGEHRNRAFPGTDLASRLYPSDCA
jgi:hypothetical protein